MIARIISCQIHQVLNLITGRTNVRFAAQRGKALFLRLWDQTLNSPETSAQRGAGHKGRRFPSVTCQPGKGSWAASHSLGAIALGAVQPRSTAVLLLSAPVPSTHSSLLLFLHWYMKLDWVISSDPTPNFCDFSVTQCKQDNFKNPQLRWFQCSPFHFHLLLQI